MNFVAPTDAFLNGLTLLRVTGTAEIAVPWWASIWLEGVSGPCGRAKS